MNLKQLLADGLSQFGLESSVDPLMDFLSLLQKWNKAYNLTALRDHESMVKKHLLDSIAIAGWIRGTRVLDVGTGPGLPGIPLAIICPDMQWVLLDSNGKKIRFLTEAKRILHLNNVEIVEQRVEDYQALNAFDTIVSRAFTNIPQLIQWTRHLLKENGLWLAMKGAKPSDELMNIKENYQVNPYTIPGLEASRCVVLIDNLTKE